MRRLRPRNGVCSLPKFLYLLCLVTCLTTNRRFAALCSQPRLPLKISNLFSFLGNCLKVSFPSAQRSSLTTKYQTALLAKGVDRSSTCTTTILIQFTHIKCAQVAYLQWWSGLQKAANRSMIGIGDRHAPDQIHLALIIYWHLIALLMNPYILSYPILFCSSSLERQLRLMMTSVDELTMDSQKFVQYQRQAAKLHQNKVRPSQGV